LPGFAFRSGFRKKEKTNLDHKPFAEATFLSVLSAMFLHSIWIFLASIFTSYSIDYKTAFILLVGQRGADLDHAMVSAMAHPYAIFAYHFSLLLISWSLGIVLRTVVIKWKWDCNGSYLSSFLKFDTPWYYLFNGIGIGQKANNNERGVDGVFVSAIVTVNTTRTFLYTGILSDYYIDKDGVLDRLILTNSTRRKIEDDKEIISAYVQSEGDEELSDQNPVHAEQFYPIDGDCLVLRNSEIITLNIQYLHLSPADIFEDTQAAQ